MLLGKLVYHVKQLDSGLEAAYATKVIIMLRMLLVRLLVLAGY